MIVEVEQFVRLRRLFTEAIADIPAGPIFHGVMFEVPAACLQAREMLEVADFGSIGTNDLIQYLFAVDRNNEQVAYDCSPDRPVFWSLIRRIVEAAEQTGRPLSVCGELAGDSRYLPRLREIGIRTVSVAPRLIPGLRRSLIHPLDGQPSPA
jgi:phosphotransferase system enzyme I (PtsI)